MTQPLLQPQPQFPSTQRVIFLPPGVMPAPQPAAPQAAPPSGLPFDRQFFEHVLPGSIAAFCQQVGCDTPVVEMLTVDGFIHYVRGVSGLSDAWVALHTRVDHHEHDVQVFVPYATIFRVSIHPAEDERRGSMGFLADLAGRGTRAVKPAPAPRKVAPAAAAAKPARSRTRKAT